MRIDLPDGQWADLKTVTELTGADQDAIFDEYDRISEDKPRPEPQPDPQNPAVMLPAPPLRFSAADNRAIRDAVLGVVITAWSYDHIPLPYGPEARRLLPQYPERRMGSRISAESGKSSIIPSTMMSSRTPPPMASTPGKAPSSIRRMGRFRICPQRAQSGTRITRTVQRIPSHIATNPESRELLTFPSRSKSLKRPQ